MTFNTSWDVNKYKQDHEIEKHWGLKRKFLLAHKSKYPEQELICLAQTFMNIEILGCTYNAELMDTIKELSAGIVDAAHLRKKEQIQETFAPFSTAAAERVKARFEGPSSSSSSGNQQKHSYINFVKESVDKPKTEDYYATQRTSSKSRTEPEAVSNPITLDVRAEYKIVDNQNSTPLPVPDISLVKSFLSKKEHNKKTDPTRSGETSSRNNYEVIDLTDSPGPSQAQNQGGYEARSSTAVKRSFEQETTGQKYAKRDNGALIRRMRHIDVREVMESGPFGKVVIFQNMSGNENAASIIERTATAAHMSASYTYDNRSSGVSCRLMLGNIFLASGEGYSQKSAKDAACKIGIERLQETSFTIQVKVAFAGCGTVERNMESGSSFDSGIDTPLDDDNIGNKLMKLMGWTGGGLGKNAQGIAEPIRATDTSIKRSGLGISNFNDFRRKATRILEEFAQSDSRKDLIFSPDFTKDERKMIHELVRKYNLKSRSFGKEEESRQIVVSKKITPREIVEDLIECGGETDKYVLIPPKSI